MTGGEGLTARFEGFSQKVTHAVGRPWAFLIALLVIVLWAVSGPVFGFGDTWQLVINTSTTIVTFLMVFLIQRAQNKDAAALHLKLNEIVAALQGASNRLINVEALNEGEVQTLHGHYDKLVALARQDGDLHKSHSIDEAETRHETKRRRGSRA